MEKESPKDIELEHELEALYQEVANEKNPSTPIKESEIPATDLPPSQTGEPSSIEQEKRKPRFLYIAASAIVSFILALVFAASFFWPSIRQHYASYSSGKLYSLRINKTVGKSVIVPPVEDIKPKAKTEIESVIGSSKQSNGKKYSIQVRAYPGADKAGAAEFLSDLRKIHPDVYAERANIRGRGIWYRILIGHFTNIEEASAYMKEKKVLEAYPGSFVQVISEGQS